MRCRPKIEALCERMQDASLGVEVKDRRYRMKTYQSCFIGMIHRGVWLLAGLNVRCAASEMTTWLARELGSTREEAVQKGQEILDRKLIVHVLEQHDIFKDELLFFRFADGQVCLCSVVLAFPHASIAG